MSNVDKLMSGSIDTHVHFIPDSLVGRRQDALRLAQSARESGMRAIVLKSREYITVAVGLLAGQLVLIQRDPIDCQVRHVWQNFLGCPPQDKGFYFFF